MEEPSVGVWLFVAYRAMEERILTALQEAGYQATLAQGRVFARIGEHGTRPSELARMAQITKQTAGVLIDQLVRLGYVERVPDPGDQRAVLIKIAPYGREAQALARTVEHQVEAEWEAHLGVEDMQRLREIMRRLREVTDPWRDS